MGNYQGIEDELVPLYPNLYLQQYDNYEIHDFYCDDINYSVANVAKPELSVKFQNWLAVERVSPHGIIECDFEAIALLYP